MVTDKDDQPRRQPQQFNFNCIIESYCEYLKHKVIIIFLRKIVPKIETTKIKEVNENGSYSS
jgi:hypothetical protein